MFCHFVEPPPSESSIHQIMIEGPGEVLCAIADSIAGENSTACMYVKREQRETDREADKERDSQREIERARGRESGREADSRSSNSSDGKICNKVRR